MTFFGSDNVAKFMVLQDPIKNLLVRVFVFVGLVIYSGQSTAGEAEWLQLMQSARQAYIERNYLEATKHSLQAIALAEETFGSEHAKVASSLFWLADSQKMLRRYAEAMQLYERALTIREKVLGKDHPDVAACLYAIAFVHELRGEHANKLSLLRRAIEIDQKNLGENSPEFAKRLERLAESLSVNSEFGEAEQLYKRAISILLAALGEDHPDFATGLENIAQFYSIRMNRKADAELMLKRALVIREKTLSNNPIFLIHALYNLGGLYMAQHKYSLAELNYQRALEITEKAYGHDHFRVSEALLSLAKLRSAQKKYEEAERLLLRALDIVKKDDLTGQGVGGILFNLGQIYGIQEKHDEAEALYKRALEDSASIFGAEHRSLSNYLIFLAGLYRKTGRTSEAETMYKRALTILEKSAVPNDLSVAQQYYGLAQLYKSQSRYADALSSIRKANLIYRSRIVKSGMDEFARLEKKQGQFPFLFHLSWLIRNPSAESESVLADEALQIAQLEQSIGTAAAVAKMAARFASGDDALAELIRRRQDTLEALKNSEAKWISALSQSLDMRQSAEGLAIHDAMDQARKNLIELDAELSRSFPDYLTLTLSEPLTLAQLQAQLRPDEGLLAYTFGPTSDSDHAYGYLVTPQAVRFLSLDLKGNALAELVKSVRGQMEFDAFGNVQPVKVDMLHSLYQGLVAPFEDGLKDVKHLIVVPAGPLQSLPFSMLVVTPPKNGAGDAPDRLSEHVAESVSNSDVRSAGREKGVTKTLSTHGKRLGVDSKTDWLIRHYAISVLPSIASIRAFRKFAKSPDQQQAAFAGFGDPLINDGAAGTRGKRNGINIADVFRNSQRPVGLNGASSSGNEIADVDSIRRLTRLPETADELKAMATVLKVGPETIWLREQATETRIKQLPLDKFRTLAFATHGVMAGEVKGVGEPGLILTPPKTGTLADDGYLAASEVAQLKLNADWVLLSACNTAAADGTPGAEGLSGLAKAFFYAGARSLLVSYWPVASKATVSLTTNLLQRYKLHPGEGKAEAHRQAMLTLMSNPRHPEYAHPLFWAPFVVVGEGGAQN